MKIKKSTKSILDEIFENSIKSDFKVVEARAQHVFASMFNFVDMIEKLNISDEEKDFLIKRIMICIKTKDSSRFNNALKRFQKKE